MTVSVTATTSATVVPMRIQDVTRLLLASSLAFSQAKQIVTGASNVSLSFCIYPKYLSHMEQYVFVVFISSFILSYPFRFKKRKSIIFTTGQAIIVITGTMHSKNTSLHIPATKINKSSNII